MLSVILLIFLVDRSFAIYKVINSKSSAVAFKYNDGVQGESGLHECQLDEVCSAVHKRFWMPTLSERFCRCSNGIECPWQWDKNPDNVSMTLNNRSHLKFCTTKKTTCTHKQLAVTVYGKGNSSNAYLVPHNVTVNCLCPKTHYWKLQKYSYEENDNIIQVFRCVKQRMCERFEFCGNVRSDLYSVYYQCTCPWGHLCIYKDKMLDNVQELLYSGPAYRAYCYPFPKQ
ncbi:uncharacterized protein LOC107274090 isoform X1 [Cephus cinctus]|uniref:Uncharacterized protein LOC107274090 isoform X1 n=1 Tax=Cephus cinctus TaxID=211228 RepID=A0AAJ7CDT0_CEPCN|nr:uncharacterized protein LOC107274090 isoform X1 [Cephus cinctus]